METSPVPVEFSTPSVPQEASVPLAPDTARERLAALPPRERTSRFLGAALKVIENRRNQGFFDGSEEQKANAEFALCYEGTGVDKSSTLALKGMLGSLEAINDEAAKGIMSQLTENLRVKIAENGNEQFLTLEEWNAKLAAATPEERARLEEEGLYGFMFPSEDSSAATVQSESARPQSPEDLVITTQISTLEKQIILAKARGEDTRGKEGRLITLRLAAQANGEVGVLLKVKALQDLKDSGVAGLDDSLQSLGERVPAAQQKLIEYLSVQGVSESDIIAACGLGGRSGLDRLITQGILDKVEGLDELVFGKEMVGENLEKLLDTNLTPEEKQDLLRKYGKKAGLGLLLLILSTTFGAVDFGKQVAK